MKAPLLKDIGSRVQSITLQDLVAPFFDPNWHFHPHYQLFTVFEGSGTRLIGDSVQTFEPGDTVFLGPNVPHLWRSDPEYFQSDSSLHTRGIVLYFQEDFLGKEFFERPEMHPIAQFLKESARGFVYHGNTRKLIRRELRDWLELSDFSRLMRVIELLNELAQSPDARPIASVGYVNTYKVSETERMQKVHNYVLQNYRNEIRLSEIASIAGMSEAAFCRYFKARSNKTFMDFVNEIRIGHTCKLLLEDNLNISQIAFDSGFDTLSNFNRYFKKLTGKTPREYRKDYSMAAS